ncbi:MAG: hypothetical protein RL701_4577 [Pseudomonadota bacterium]|jgi:hypothetical protein
MYRKIASNFEGTSYNPGVGNVRSSVFRVCMSALLAGWVGNQASPVRADLQARVLCEITENGATATGVVSILKDEKEIASASCGRELLVPAGDYVASLRLDGALDGPERRQPVSLKAGSPVLKLSADFSTATLEVKIASSGRRAAGMAIIKRDGQQLGTLGSGVAAHLSAGTYHIYVRYRSQEKDLGVLTLASKEQRTLEAVFE